MAQPKKRTGQPATGAAEAAPKTKAAKVDGKDALDPKNAVKDDARLDGASLTDTGVLKVSSGADPMGSHEPVEHLVPAAPSLPAENESALPFLKKMLPWLSWRLLQWIPCHMPELGTPSALGDLEPLKIGAASKEQGGQGFKEVYNLDNMAVGLRSMNLYEAGFTLCMADLRPDEEDDELWCAYDDKARFVVIKTVSLENWE